MKSTLSSRIPVVLSVLLFPGSGQLLQRRWIAGGAFLLFFLSAFLWVMISAGLNIVSYYRLGFEFETYDPEPISLFNLLLAFGVAVSIYIANIIDVSVAQHRIRSRQALEQFMNENSLK
jgi:hypothetical protein